MLVLSLQTSLTVELLMQNVLKLLSYLKRSKRKDFDYFEELFVVTVAQGVVDATKNMGDAITVPIIVRLQGTMQRLQRIN
jgi:succinyl-CoA synthetase beta subunit